MMAEVTGEAGTLLAGLREEVVIYGNILAISGEELKLVKDAELEQATQMLSKKQQMLEDITAIESRVKPMKEQWPTIRAKLPGPVQGQFSDVLRNLSELLERLIAIERETEEILARQIAIVKKGAGAAATEDRAKKAYGAQADQTVRADRPDRAVQKEREGKK
jgi:K+/H+ antiporter YhaU regulatory subunit KhtT